MTAERRAETCMVTAIVIHNGKVLVYRKRPESQGGRDGNWRIPLGKVNKNESELMVLVRLFVIKTNLMVWPGKYIGWQQGTNGMTIHWYEGRPESPDIYIGCGQYEAKWVPATEVVQEYGEKEVSLWPQEVKDYFKNLVNSK